MNKAQCEFDPTHRIQPNHLILDDNYLYRRVMHFCTWKCVRCWMQENNFAIKKESLFAIDIGTTVAQPLNIRQ